MKVRVAVFNIALHPKLTMAELVLAIQSHAQTRYRYLGQPRVVHVEEHADHIYGSILTDKGIKNFLAINTQTNVSSRGSLAGDNNFGAFNFFLICKRSKKALITHYAESGGQSMVFGLLGEFAHTRLVAIRDAELVAVPDGSQSRKQKEKIRKAYDVPAVKHSEFLGREGYETVLRRWKKIGAIEVVLPNLESAPAFIPADDDAIENGSWRSVFKRGTTVSRAVSVVKHVWDNISRPTAAEVLADNAEEGDILKVLGKDEFGLLRTVILDDRIPSMFGELDHDTIISDSTSFAPLLRASYVIRHLASIVTDNPGTFR